MKRTLKTGPLTHVQTNVATVLRISDVRGQKKPIVLDRSEWFRMEGAHRHAKKESEKYPKPQKCVVFDGFSDNPVAIYQNGETVPLFELK